MNARNPQKVLLPIGIDNFHDLITRTNSEGHRNIFVDKTLFIKEFLDIQEKITLITRPRRFGKTLTLSMLEHFLAPTVRGQSTQGLFAGLAITQYPKIMAKQGKSPVIFLTLKEAKGENFQETFETMQEIIFEVYDAHKHLLPTLDESDCAVFKKILHKKANQAEYQSSLKFLSKLLYQHTGKKVYIFLDEYDTPINHAYINGYFKECVDFFVQLFGKTFKGNDYLNRGLITGILKIAKENLFSGLNNPQVYTMLSDARYATCFGFSPEETDDLLDRAGLPQQTQKLKEMYNGYQIEGHTLYNPFSIVSFISEALLRGEDDIEKSLKPYWVNTGGTGLITELMRNNFEDLVEGLENLIQDIPVKTSIDENVVFSPHMRSNPIAFWSVMLMAGYFKIVKKEKNEIDEYEYELLFPNQEIKRTMRLILTEVAAGSPGFKKNYKQGIYALAQGDIPAFTKFLKRYMKSTPSYFDTGGKKRELFYHGLMLGMASVLTPIYYVTSNRESGDGRYDIALLPKEKGRHGMLFELKMGQPGDDLLELAREARAQIDAKNYQSELEAREVEEILQLGIAFRDKEIEVVV